MRIATLFSGIGAPEQGAKRVYGDDLEDERGQLIYQYIRVVEECMPPVIVYENVKGMMSITGGRTIKEFVQALRDIGYYCHYEVINTKDYGVPQNRERLFLTGFLCHDQYHRFSYANKQKLDKRLKDVLEDEVDEKYYLSDTTIDKISKWNAQQDPLADTSTNRVAGCLTARGAGEMHSGMALIQVPSATKCGYETAVAGDAINVAHLGSATGRGRVGKQRSQALTTGGTMCIVKDDMRIRKLTPRECLRLQDFPDTFEIVVSYSQAYKQAGNSMSVNILEMIFNQIDKAEAGHATNTLMDFAI